MKDYQNLFAVRENNLTAEEIACAETLVLFLCKDCIPALPKMNAPEYLVKAVAELLKKNDKLADCGSMTHFAMLGANGLQQVVISGFGGKDACKPNDLRKAAGETARVLKKLKTDSALVIAPILLNAARPHYLSALVEGLILGGSLQRQLFGKRRCLPCTRFGEPPRQPAYAAGHGAGSAGAGRTLRHGMRSAGRQRHVR